MKTMEKHTRSAAPTTSVPSRELADLDFVQKLGRPPWHVASTREISDATGISFARLSNWITRRQWPAPEPRQLYRRVGNKSLFRIDRVTQWLTGASIDDQALRYMESVGLGPGELELWAHVAYWERLELWPHVWQPLDVDTYVAFLLTMK
jgi:hypothetical protein